MFLYQATHVLSSLYLIRFQSIKDKQLYIIIGALVTFVLAILVAWEIVSPHEMVILSPADKVTCVCGLFLSSVGVVLSWKKTLP